jgi:hypothetical protein
VRVLEGRVKEQEAGASVAVEDARTEVMSEKDGEQEEMRRKHEEEMGVLEGRVKEQEAGASVAVQEARAEVMSEKDGERAGGDEEAWVRGSNASTWLLLVLWCDDDDAAVHLARQMLERAQCWCEAAM